MNEFWLQINIIVPAAGIDLVCHEMTELGSAGITVEERALDTFVVPDPDADIPETLILKVYFPPEIEPEQLARQVAERLAWLAPLIPGLEVVTPEISRVRAEDWAENWKQHFGIQRIGSRLVIRPTWEAFSPDPQDAVLTLDPGMAFGTGSHATTRLCLEALAELYETPPGPQRVLDVGTGSGILAVAAALLGAGQVLGCDIDETACQVALDNARQNGVIEQIAVTLDPLETLGGDFDVVLANILAEENARLAPELVHRLAPGGVLILSGILNEKEQLVIDAFAGRGLTGPDIRRQDEWSCLCYIKEA
ncbi:ribosomal protein L11 methyltransferase [Syntrophotalea carbinolica DSM 2380]|uniref:Ribosomal protein L11 methyltransferase n=1 Tax=Syntrophotalea carbinolica (strain DSM 2380 / NBRC 103641 / GraBd1) TaxID=338963 RepID=PRMA_SYNC1|nr:50S ribosomal protein L11 methyltransferase [Syntrophotalea carbinolica]Q39ZZ2.1 RecName: Full=Ribosomal protein L11 methyltransferase; Short=L11 Mtase [Syntrophotalea carbinolica DSM 2380]ABA90315.1 ribosomal protein L11 methyltransferase [Syntrophotalea carbinolica DSM 2380]